MGLFYFFKPFTKRQILGSPNLEELADDTLKCDKNDEKFSTRVENAMGKGEIDRYDTQCFQPYFFKPFTKRQILGSPNLKEFADDTFKCDKNGEKFSKTVENAMGRGEIARYEQFLLLPQRFQKIYTADT